MRSCRFFCFLIVPAVVLGLLTSCSKSSNAPGEIIGIWKTQDRGSEGVSVEFRHDRIIISSDLGVMEDIITQVKSQKGHLHNTTLYSIYYSDQGGEKNLMNILYSPEDGGSLRFKSEQDTIWKRSR